ncbi:MAG TPA: cob(I)yrinic acid a,c-diamide adenosyltransferase [Opitutales bacterium]|nr:cob(I)yrinic acid a,c-diamide adenosyltransferase [Opitutales bacterium]
MSIATRTGDNGTTALAFNRRVGKNHPRVKAYGAIDEFSSALGLGRAFAAKPEHKETILRIQKDLLRIMAVLAVDDADRERMGSRYNPIAEADVAWLDSAVAEMEKRTPPFTGWVLPGDSPASAHLHPSRTVCRRAEREIVAAMEAGCTVDAPLLRYINRLSDICWLLARDGE